MQMFIPMTDVYFCPIVPNVPPMNVTVERMSSTSMSVSWTPLDIEEARGFVTHYTVFYELRSDANGSVPNRMNATVNGDGNYTQVDGLQSKEAYVVSVGANTRIGLGNLSKPVILDEASDDKSEAPGKNDSRNASL